jgi:hypothetical protein
MNMDIKSNILSYVSINGCYNFLDLENNSTNSNYKNPSRLFFETNYNHKTDTFGLFITIERELHKLSKWPEKVHGCLGYYEREPFSSIDKDLTISKSSELGHNTAYTDNRKDYYPALFLDYKAKFKVSLMKLPLYNINSNTGMMSLTKLPTTTKLKKGNKTNKLISNTKKTKKTKNAKNISQQIQFNNNKYGLLTISSTKQTATYLPEVFKNTSWSTIKSNLTSKAGITTTQQPSNISFYGYNTDVQHTNLMSFFTNKQILSLKYLEHIIAIEPLFNNTHVPVYNITVSNQLNYDTNEFVRNCGICSDMIKAIYFVKKYLDSFLVSEYYKIISSLLLKCITYLDSLWKMFETAPTEHTQNTSFIVVGYCYYLQIINLDKKLILPVSYNLSKHIILKRIQKYCQYILDNKTSLETKFEYGECGVALYTASKFSYLKKFKSIIGNYIIPYNLKIGNQQDDIFQVNWITQMLCVINKTTTQSHTQSSTQSHTQYIKQVTTTLIQILDTYYLPEFNKQPSNPKGWKLSLETNFIAVAYEACMNLYLSNKINELDIKTIEKINQYIVLLSLGLISRKNGNNPLYKFISGDTRLDITGHTIVV